ncbi:methylmalonyl Co-A mutase-associated GTPase MeaB [Lederbergia lenta]|uniref:Arginine/ornithine transporter ATPase n=1 Tax=Lederbergia lenta TaxID=1467 RepID=A0A2X4W128_LEDLE|nr:methylmalonyl Co-A mutase-associated GTPase MeaB [Lederbergia lenta]MEC2325116.1 methylmalonyl Co-A mutase-associated GTPase MeaB [Lederbergia lenta]SQI56389.1 arginine/ornithine transporter ATPase [Lederbergia lenta]
MTKHARKKFIKKERSEQSAKQLTKAILNGNRKALFKAITLIESNAQHHQERAQEMLQPLLAYAGRSIRIGITGVPGAGKSTFIEAFGKLLCDQGYRVAVLAVDPSSTVNGGSILGDKTRMEELAKHENAFIRPSPSSGTLGGVHKKTRETIIACEAAGFDLIIIETVGIGQSESVVRGMVDFFLMLVLTGAGDELQGMKKGVLELVDAIAVNKADGDNLKLAIKTRREYAQILHLLRPATIGWETKAVTCSSLTGDGIESIWSMIQNFTELGKTSSVFYDRRNAQVSEWLHAMIKDRLELSFYQHEKVGEIRNSIEADVIQGKLTVTKATDQLFRAYQDNKK